MWTMPSLQVHKSSFWIELFDSIRFGWTNPRIKVTPEQQQREESSLKTASRVYFLWFIMKRVINLLTTLGEVVKTNKQE